MSTHKTKISILVPKSSVLQATADPQYLFAAVNRFVINQGKEAKFEVSLVGIERQVVLNDGAFTVQTDFQIGDPHRADLVIIPALFGDLTDAITQNAALIPWIKQQYQQGAEVASLCLGAFLLAATGLLDGKKCSTHWGFADEFRTMFPDVEVIDGSILTEEGRLYSSGGANSYWNLLLHLVEKYVDRETAVMASKYFAIDIDRNSQAAYSLFRGQKGHQDHQILLAQHYIEENIDSRITIDELAELTALGRRSFERRFKAATKNTVLEYIQRVKIETAKRSYENSRKNVLDVMYEVGYTDSKAFRLVFKKLTGLTPMAYRNKYNKLPVDSAQFSGLA
ncbi:GlxA family transcriptional regulator [Dyadobacter tibetensis]|uniref:GlxA family transcriptional regulator n=1 Tax=Dyadobacter tibetensis TaxID=1211851 RepID=UPI0004712A43|nr:helix-turn-helix domain-containing protein [Dyadobacter tibetensis]